MLGKAQRANDNGLSTEGHFELPDPYGPNDWRDICTAIRKVRAGEVPEHIRDAIKRVALGYEGTEKFLIGEINERAAWKRVCNLLHKLKAALSEVSYPELLLNDIDRIGLLVDTRSEPQQPAFSELPAFLFLREEPKLVHKLFDHMTNVAEQRCHDRLGGSKWKNVSEERVTRLLCYRELLAIWTDQVGGKLSSARNPYPPYQPRGPLIDFLKAAVGPVMGQAPSLESLHDAIRREKLLRQDEG